MTYKKYRDSLKQQMYGYMLYMMESRNPNDVKKIDDELHRLKNEIQCLDDLTESQLHEQRKTVTHIIESAMKYLK